MPPRDTTRSTSTAAPCSTGGSGDGPAFTAPSAASLARSFTVRWDRTLLILVAADEQVDQVDAGPEPHQLAGAGRAEPELFPGQLHVP